MGDTTPINKITKGNIKSITVKTIGIKRLSSQCYPLIQELIDTSFTKLVDMLLRYTSKVQDTNRIDDELVVSFLASKYSSPYVNNYFGIMVEDIYKIYPGYKSVDIKNSILIDNITTKVINDRSVPISKFNALTKGLLSMAHIETIKGKHFAFTYDALKILQITTEKHVIALLTSAYVISKSNRRVTLMARDIEAAINGFSIQKNLVI